MEIRTTLESMFYIDPNIEIFLNVKHLIKSIQECTFPHPFLELTEMTKRKEGNGLSHFWNPGKK